MGFIGSNNRAISSLVAQISLSGVLLLGSLFCAAQQKIVRRPPENGRPELAWWDENRFKQDSLEDAVFLFKSGMCTANPEANTRIDVQERIKILKKSGVGKKGNFQLSTKTKLVKFSATVYNMEKGKIREWRVDGRNLVNQRDSAGYNIYSLALSDVTVGSVIEYTYTCRAPVYTIFDWDFQDEIPVKYSEYELLFAGNIYGVTAHIRGLYSLAEYRVTESGRRRRFVMTNLPAFREEPFMPPRFYYISAISFLNYSITGKFELVYSKDHLKISGLQRDSLKMNTHAAVEASLTIEDKSLKGIVKITKRGYEAHRDRQRLKVYDVNDYLHYELYNPAILIGKKKLEHTEDTLSMVITYDFSSALTSANRDKLLFIDPQVFMPDEFTSLTAETRSYPVDLGSMIEKILIASLTIPENYAVDQLPENVILTLPDKSARFVKSMVVIGNKINIAIRLSTTRIIFNVPEYPALREFFMQVSAKRNEMIVLRKIE